MISKPALHRFLSTGLLGALLLALPLEAPAADQNFRQRVSQQEASFDDLADIRAEVAFGHEIAARILGRFGRLQNTELTRYLNLVGKGLALHAGRPELEFHFAVLDSSEINAFAAPGGYIFVTRGALLQMTDEAELAAVLAHEIAHVTERHIVRELKIRSTDAPEGAALASMIGGMTDPLRVALVQMVDKAVEILLVRGYQRQDESDADHIGTTLLALTGYDPSALIRFLDSMSATAGSNTVANLGTHPPNSVRTADLRGFLQENNLTATSSALLKERFASHVQLR